MNTVTLSPSFIELNTEEASNLYGGFNWGAAIGVGAAIVGVALIVATLPVTGPIITGAGAVMAAKISGAALVLGGSTLAGASL